MSRRVDRRGALEDRQVLELADRRIAADLEAIDERMARLMAIARDLEERQKAIRTRLSEAN